MSPVGEECACPYFTHFLHLLKSAHAACRWLSKHTARVYDAVMSNEKRSPEEVPKSVRDLRHQLDMAETRHDSQYDGPDSLPFEISAGLLREVDEFLREQEVGSTEELNRLLEKLDAAIAITNDPDAKQLRKKLLARYGGDTDPGGDGI